MLLGRVASATATQSPFPIDGLFKTITSDFLDAGNGRSALKPYSSGNVSFDEARFRFREVRPVKKEVLAAQPGLRQRNPQRQFGAR